MRMLIIPTLTTLSFVLGLLFSSISIATENLPTLSELQQWHEDNSQSNQTKLSKIRDDALRESALRVGAQGGFAFTSQQFNDRLQARSAELNQIFRFDALLVDQARMLPPVIIEARNNALFTTDRATLTQQIYRINETAKLISAAPTWQQYLLTAKIKAPKKPLSLLLPQTKRERQRWRKAVAEGWREGVVQAERSLQRRIAQLRRAFIGRVRYHMLVLRGLVKPVKIKRSKRRILGNTQELRIGEEVLRISRPARLVKNSRQWQLLPQLPNAFSLEVGNDD